MKISKSKQELARIISENGGWRYGAESAAQCKSDNAVSFYSDIPDRDGDCWWGEHLYGLDISQDKLIANWHQSCLSRAEYFHLYPAQDAKPEFCESVMRSIPEPEINSKNINITQVEDINVVESKPTIEQLAADYRNLLGFALRKQREADDAKADADEKLRVLELAGETLSLLVSPITEKQEPELVITDWRDLQAGDVISVSGRWWEPDSEYTVDENDGSRDAPIRVGDYWALIGYCSFKFIRRP